MSNVNVAIFSFDILAAVLETPSSASGQEERAEVEAVLHSGIFARAPNLESFFKYVCDHHLRGRAEQLKEYNIAVEALGRAPDFDQKKDSIVRVEAHRLRRRLSEYYAGPAVRHPIHILIPRGSYAPRFVTVDSPMSQASSQISEAVVEQAELSLAAPGHRSGGVGWMLGCLLAIAVFGFIRWRFFSGDSALSQSGNEVWHGSAGDVVPAEFRMMAGYHGPTFIDVQGRDWHSDAYFTGGRSMAVPRDLAIQGLPSSGFLKSARTGRFHYEIPVREGIYEIHLYFAETEYGIGNPRGGGDGSRLFRLAINGSNRVNLFDVHAEACGPDRLFVRVFKDISRAADGKIHISSSRLPGWPF